MVEEHNRRRKFSPWAHGAARSALAELLDSANSPARYRQAMFRLGSSLGEIVDGMIPSDRRCLVVSTAEDVDFLATGVIQSLVPQRRTRLAVFWNNYMRLSGGAIAPIVHRYLQPGYEDSDCMVVVKSIISTSCVIRTNILALIEKIGLKDIYIVAPVMLSGADEVLRGDFPEEVVGKFKFVYFAVDQFRDERSGNVLPGIGGRVYSLLGLDDQPALTGYIPDRVRELTRSQAEAEGSVVSLAGAGARL